MISMFDLNKYLLVIFSREGLTGAKFEVKIWTLIGGSCLNLLQTKTMSTLTKKKSFVKYQWRKINKLCCDPRDIHPAFAVGPPQHRMIVCYEKFQHIPFGACVEHLSLRLCSWDFFSCSWDLRCSWFMRFMIATWSSRHLHCCEEVSQKNSSKCFNLNQPALQ